MNTETPFRGKPELLQTVLDSMLDQPMLGEAVAWAEDATVTGSTLVCDSRLLPVLCDELRHGFNYPSSRVDPSELIPLIDSIQPKAILG